MCSTPVGVKGSLTRAFTSSYSRNTGAQRLSASKDLSRGDEQGEDKRKLLVLNACRRQRISHVGIRHPVMRPALGAQRLSASKDLSPPSAQQLLAQGRVLNACRRQRISHHQTIRFGGARPAVLNACRRQRISHVPFNWRVATCWACSTPVGVKGSLTQLRCKAPVLARRVLNACRRQRISHTGLTL
ncbi:hypothetical protein PLANPX_0691 [Lacipirellula parvula]|uniref:Uncharacterized protein n=1 Tax=Lacipirellula parvula TaxID=2650471 RepID=A0A5K7XDH7_9BACT|nr:hypothetical protein PLANPX_0691 [Lacipirellula parvula]